MGSGTSWKELEQRISEAIKLPSRAVAVAFLDAAPAGLEEFKGTEPLDAVQPLPEKWVELQVKNVGKDVEISVTDSGKGIPKKIRDKMGQPFFTTKVVGQGTGLGLSISRGIVEAHGGSLHLDPDCEHTRFVAILPKAVA